MNKVELIQALKDATDLSKLEVAAVVDTFFNGMATVLANGDRVRFGGCAHFSLINTGLYTGRNPKTGEKVKVAPKNSPFLPLKTSD